MEKYVQILKIKLEIGVFYFIAEKEASSGEYGKTKTHKEETHGTSADIDEDTPISKVKGPNIFERAKEEIEAIVEAIHPHKKDSDH